MQRIGMMLVVASVAVAGCGTRATIPAPPPVPDTSTDQTIEYPVTVDEAETTTAGPATAPTEPTNSEPVEVPDVAADEIDSMLNDIDDTLAELDQILNDAAAALAAEEGEIIP